MSLLMVWLLVLFVLVVVCVAVLVRRQRRNKGTDEWSAGQEHLPRLSETTDTTPHIDGGGGGGGISGAAP
jgi:heme/copper-type cytochrome/quinol oxidase subunit 2